MFFTSWAHFVLSSSQLPLHFSFVLSSQRHAAADRIKSPAVDILFFFVFWLWLILIETHSNLASPSLHIARRLVLPESRRVCQMPFFIYLFIFSFNARVCVFCFWEAICCCWSDSSLVQSRLSSRGKNYPSRSTCQLVFLIESLAEKIVSRSCVAVVGSLKRPRRSLVSPPPSLFSRLLLTDSAA